MYNKRLLFLLMFAAATAVLSIYVNTDDNPENPPVQSSDKVVLNRTQGEITVKNEYAQLARRHLGQANQNIFHFVPKTVAVPEPVYVPPPVVEAPPPPPPEPPPPPPPLQIPFTFLGRFESQGGPPKYFVLMDNKVLVVQDGDVIAGQYQIKRMEQGKLEVLYLPTQQTGMFASLQGK